MAQLIRYVTVFCIGFLFVLAQPHQASAKKKDDSQLKESVNGLKQKVRRLAKQVKINTQEIAVLTEAVATQNYDFVDVDCNADPYALQDAVDSAPSAGRAIGVIGECAQTFLVGKENIVIDGLGSGSIAGDSAVSGFVALYVEASQNIVIQNITVNANSFSQAVAIWDSTSFIYNSTFTGGEASALEINRGAYAAFGNLILEGSGNTVLRVANNAIAIADETIDITNSTGQRSVVVEHNASLTQASGNLTANGGLYTEYGASVFLVNAEISGDVALFASRNSNVTLASDQNISVAGNIQAFSASNITLSISGAMALSGDYILIQRNSSMQASGSGVADVNYPSISARQNAVIDYITVNFVTPPALELILGSGMRLFGDPQVASCDASAWTAFSVSCAE